LGVGSDWFGSLLEPSAIAISSGYIIATDGMIQTPEQGVEQKPVAAVVCHRSFFNLWRELFRPLPQTVVDKRRMSF
jgi:hypothetical protein